MNNNNKREPFIDIPQALRDIVNHNSQTALAVVQHLRILEANSAFAELVCVSNPADLRSRSLAEFMSPQDLSRAAGLLERFGGKEGGACFCNFTGCDGKSVRARVLCLRWPANAAIGLLITDEAADEYNSDGADRVVPDLVSSISHEVRNPLTAILGYCGALLDEVAGPVNDSQRAMVQRITDTAKAMLAVSDDMLRSARVNQISFAVRPRLCKPWRVAKTVYEMLKPTAEAKGLRFMLNVRVEAIRGVYDREKLRTVLNNLLSNAIKYTESGTVEMMVDSRADGVEVIVADTGVGIAQERLLEVFAAPDGKRSAADAPEPSFGIGLTMAARMIEAMQGTLVVSSEEGIGSAFTLCLPAIPEEAAAQ